MYQIIISSIILTCTCGSSDTLSCLADEKYLLITSIASNFPPCVFCSCCPSEGCISVKSDFSTSNLILFIIVPTEEVDGSCGFFLYVILEQHNIQGFRLLSVDLTFWLIQTEALLCQLQEDRTLFATNFQSRSIKFLAVSIS